MNIDQAIETLTKLVADGDNKCPSCSRSSAIEDSADALRYTQAALNLAHVKDVIETCAEKADIRKRASQI